jgi:hypothetical protein
MPSDIMLVALDLIGIFLLTGPSTDQCGRAGVSHWTILCPRRSGTSASRSEVSLPTKRFAPDSP